MTAKENLSGCNLIVAKAFELKRSLTRTRKNVERSAAEYFGTKDYWMQLSTMDQYEREGLYKFARQRREKAAQIRKEMMGAGYGDPIEIKRRWDDEKNKNKH